MASGWLRTRRESGSFPKECPACHDLVRSQARGGGSPWRLELSMDKVNSCRGTCQFCGMIVTAFLQQVEEQGRSRTDVSMTQAQAEIQGYSYLSLEFRWSDGRDPASSERKARVRVAVPYKCRVQMMQYSTWLTA